MSSYPLCIVPCFYGPAGLQLLSIISFCLLLLLALPQVQSAAISSPSPTTSTPSNSSSPSTTALALDPIATDPTHNGSGGLSAGGKAGICIGVALGVVAMAIVLGDIWFLHSKRGTKTNGDAGISGKSLESQHAAVSQQGKSFTGQEMKEMKGTNELQANTFRSKPDGKARSAE